MSEQQPIDLRGTQGSVVLPAGTVVQNYAGTPTHIMEENKPHTTQQDIEVVLLKRDVAENTSQIRELWNAIRRFELMIAPKTIDIRLVLVVVVLGFMAVLMAIYLGGNWQ